MKKIEAIVLAKNFPKVREELLKIGSFVIEKRSVSNDGIYNEARGSAAGKAGVISVPLVKIELVVPDRNANEVIKLISKKSGIPENHPGKIYISDMQEVVDMDTMEGLKELELEEPELQTSSTKKRSRLVPLQKYTLMRIQKIYDENKELLRSHYRIKSFSDCVNYCILAYLPELEEQVKHKTIVYNRRA